MNEFFIHYSEGRYILLYVFIFIGMFIEGDGVLFAIAFVSYQGYLNPLNMVIAIFGSTLLSDICWYHIGAYVQTKHNWFARWAKHLTNPLASHLVDRPRHSIVLAKFLYGINHAIWAKAGALGLPIRTLLREDLLATTIWMVIIGGLGAASSAGLLAAKHYVHYAELGLFTGVVLLIVLSKIFTHFFRKKL